MKIEFAWQIIEKYSDTKFHENPSSGAELFRAADRHNEATSRFLQVCERA